MSAAPTSSAVAHVEQGLPRFGPDWALFLDVDGTMLDIADRPDAVTVPAPLHENLQRIFRGNGGALAIVTGRQLVDLDRLFEGCRYPAAGQHGVERRDARGNVIRLEGVKERVAAAARRIQAEASGSEGVLVEYKGLTLAIHYRLAPHLQDWVATVAQVAAAGLGDEFKAVHGNMIWEIRPSGKDKGIAIAEFMRETPFAGRVPVFVGDDATDEDGFIAVNAMNGNSIKVGPGRSAARWRAEGAENVRRWLGDFAAYLEQEPVA